MAPNPTSALLLLLLLPLLLLLSSAAAHNITRILEGYPDYSAFNAFLTQSKVADEINSRTTLTVLALDNSAAAALSGNPADVLRHVLSVHVVLDYYDAQILQKLSSKSALVTTLFQTSGLAAGRTGMLNVTDLPNGHVAFGSAAPGANLTATLVKELVTIPYNISVLQVSGVIYPPGINNLNPSPPPPPPPPPPPSAAKNAAPPAGAPKKAPTPAASPAESVSPAPSKAKHHVKAPKASSPAPSEGKAGEPTSNAPVASSPLPTALDAEAPAPAPEGASKHTSSAGRAAVGAGLAAIVMGAAFLGAL